MKLVGHFLQNMSKKTSPGLRANIKASGPSCLWSLKWPLVISLRQTRLLIRAFKRELIAMTLTAVTSGALSGVL
jgi:hypothetical protein